MNSAQSARLLLTAVFQPYGVTDPYAPGLGMQMELFDNQITREQGVHSPRASFWTFPLYFLAENTSVPATVLDFPRWQDFVRELRKGYTHVGISFIHTNILKAKRMAEHVRANHPAMRILLGGYGAVLPDVRKIVPCDEVCAGEGIRWLRRYFGENVEAPIRHPILHGVAERRLYGLRSVADDSAVIVPGLGCDKKCFFCSTSAKFGHRYVPLLPAGKDMFLVCTEAERRLGVSRFVVIDENFLERPQRAAELLEHMEADSKPYSFSVFSSADTVQKLGIDFLVRMGVLTVWLGIESQRPMFPKQRGVDPRGLIEMLQSHGITVISSSILFLDHHDSRTIEEDIEWAIGAGSDFHQFMQLVPLPGTPLRERLLRENKLIADFPAGDMSGQNRLCFVHPHFSPGEARDITRQAFRRKYLAHGPAMLNTIRTALRGYVKAAEDAELRRRHGLIWNTAALRYQPGSQPADDAFMKLRLDELRKRALMFRSLLPALQSFAPNAESRRNATRVGRLFRRTFGEPSGKERLMSAAILCAACLEFVRIHARKLLGLGELVRQPPVRRLNNDRRTT